MCLQWHVVLLISQQQIGGCLSLRPWGWGFLLTDWPHSHGLASIAVIGESIPSFLVAQHNVIRSGEMHPERNNKEKPINRSWHITTEQHHAYNNMYTNLINIQTLQHLAFTSVDTHAANTGIVLRQGLYTLRSPFFYQSPLPFFYKQHKRKGY